MTAFSQYRFQTLENAEYRKYLASLKSLLDTPGGSLWMAEMGGSDLVDANTREMLAKAEEVQRAIDPTAQGTIERAARG